MKDTVIAEVEKSRQTMLDISKFLYENPEPALEEYKAAGYLTDLLEREGFSVTRKLKGMDTAFSAVKKNGEGPRIAIMAEYDALPGNGHACGHNLISAISVGAVVALAKALKKYEGEVAIFGTPAEETAEGKPYLLEKGAFDGYDVAMMVHPAAKTCIYPPSLYLGGIDFLFTGVAAHAGESPEKGVNALDAVILFFNGVNAMRQQLRDGTRVHGIILEAGTAVNVIPDKGRVRMEMRAKEQAYHQEVVARVIRCAQAAALATGCELSYEHFEPDCHAVKQNPAMAECFRKHLEELGVKDDGVSGMVSTDMGNVSGVIPSIHPMVQVTDGMGGLHTREFLEATMKPLAAERTVISAKALALTGLDILEAPGLLAEIKAAHGNG